MTGTNASTTVAPQHIAFTGSTTIAPQIINMHLTVHQWMSATSSWPRPDDDGLAGVREPRRPAPSAPPTAR